MSLQDIINDTAEAHQENAALPFAVRAALSRIALAPDAPSAAAALVDVIAMAEGMVEGIKAAAEDMRERLAMILQELPAKALPVQGKHHTATVAAAKAGVRITDIDVIPKCWMRQPPEQPDKAAILAALKAGEPVPGCVLSNGGAPVLRINARKTT